MRRDSKVDPREAKQIARRKYAERQIQKFVNWSWENKGKIRYSDIKQLHNRYDIECYARTRRK